MLLDERPFDLGTPGYIYEIKFDGYRCLAEFGDGVAHLRSKTGGDMTAWFPEVAAALSHVPGGPHVADGEIAVLDDVGRADFDALQTRARRRRSYAGAPPVVFCAFDVLVHKGVAVMDRPLMERKRLLVPLLAGLPSVLPVMHFDAPDAPVIFNDAVLGLGLEGLVAKRMDSRYLPGTRSKDWIKVKRRGAVPAQRFKRGPKPGA